MIDTSLVEVPVSLDSFSYETPIQPSIFLGFIIKNEYDNQRLKINEDYQPKRFLRVYKINGESQLLPLYGFCLKLNGMGENIVNIISKQEQSFEINLTLYQNMLNEYNLSCNDCYAYFKSGVYPIDFNKFRILTDDKKSKDKKILQHMLNLNENKFDFQKFGSVLSLILT
jgi:hypothetical protein